MLTAIPGYAWQRQPNWTVTTENGSWLASPAGLFQYDSDNEKFIPETFPNAPHFAPFELFTDGDQLWALSDSSIGYIDLFSGGRYVYAQSDGLPAARFICLAITEDYIWAGSDQGAVRFDRLIEQWETLDVPAEMQSPEAKSINHLLALDDFVYFATDAGVLRYEIATESFTLLGRADGLRAGALRAIELIGDEIWFAGDAGIDIYSVSQRNWSYLGEAAGFRSADWIDAAYISGLLYFVFEDGIDICDPANRQIYPFERESQITQYRVNDITGARNGIWFATNKGLLQYDQGNLQSGQPESWVLYDQSRGAAYPAFSRLAGFGNYILGSGESGIDVLDQTNDTFQDPLAYGEMADLFGDKESTSALRWDDDGLSYTPNGDYRLGLTGNANYTTILEEPQTEDRFWGRLQPYLLANSGRTLNGLYNNTDPNEILYGAVYRGIEGDLLRLAEGGNRIGYQQTIDPFFGGATIRGARAMLEAGPRKGQKKRSLLRATVAAGERVTKSAREFFLGGQATTYSLEHQDLLIGSAEVYLNGRRLTDADYTLNHTSGQLYFTFTGWELLNEGDVIEVAYQYRLNEEQIDDRLIGGEVVLSSGDALQVAVSGFNLEKTLADSEGGFSGAQVAADLRGSILGGEGQLTTTLGGGISDAAGDEFSPAGSVSGSFQRKAWTLHGSYQVQTDSLAALEDRSTEFGYLENQFELGIRYEPSSRLWLESSMGSKNAAYGQEGNYHLEGQASPVQGTSLFGSLDLFDAEADSLQRNRTIASLGLETSFGQELLNKLKIRSSRLYVLAKFSEVELDSSENAASETTRLRTKSLLTRWSIIPNAKVNFLPEFRWSESERAIAKGEYLPESRVFTPQATLYTRSLIPGITTYLDGEATYTQSGFSDSTDTRNVSFERQGVAQIDIVPGTYLALFNSFSLRLNLVRNAEDSLLAIDNDISFWDLGSSWQDYPTSISSYRYDSDAAQISWTPHYQWIIYQSATELRSDSKPTEQLFSTRIEWKPRSEDQFYWRYTLNRELTSGSDLYDHRPGIEWYRRWSAKTYTRSQLYGSFIDEPNQRSWSITPGVYLDQRFAMPWHLGDGIFRLDLSGTYKDQSMPFDNSIFLAGGYGRFDWSIWKGLTSRLRFDGDYERSITAGTSGFVWSLEIRLNARF